MKTKNSKLLALVLAALMIMGTLTACSNAPANTTATNTTTTDTKGTTSGDNTTTEGTKDPVDYPVVTWYVAKDPMTDGDLVEARLNEILHENGIEANLDVIYQSSYNEKMSMMATAGENFDLAFTCGWTFSYTNNARMGAFLELTDLLNEYGQDILNFFPEKVFESSKVDGKLYAIPNWQLNCSDAVMAIPTALVEKYNLDVSDGVYDAEKLEPILKVLKENEPELYTVCWGDGLPLLYSLYYNEGTTPFKQDIVITKDLKVVFPEEQIKEHCLQLIDMYQKGYIRQDINSATDINSEKLALKYAMWYEPDKKPGCDTIYNATYGEPITLIPLMDHQVKTMNADMAAMTAIGANSKHPELAMQILNIANTNKDFYNTICYGVEGVHWNMNDNGSITMTDTFENYNPNSDWMFGCQWNAYPKDTMDLDVYDQMQEYSTTATVLPCNGFLYDVTDTQVEWTNYSTIRKEYTPLFNGSIDPDKFEETWNKYVSELKDSGILDTVIADIQTQLDAWAANK